MKIESIQKKTTNLAFLQEKHENAYNDCLQHSVSSLSQFEMNQRLLEHQKKSQNLIMLSGKLNVNKSRAKFM